MRGDQPVVAAASLIVSPSIAAEPYHGCVKVDDRGFSFQIWRRAYASRYVAGEAGMRATGHSGARTPSTGDLAGPVPVYVACSDGVTAGIVVGALEREGLNVSTQWGPLA